MSRWFLLPRIRASRLVTPVLALSLAACGAPVAPTAQPAVSAAPFPTASPAASPPASPVASSATSDAPPSLPVTAGSFSDGPSLTDLRASHTATLLLDGQVLVAGGYRGDGPNASTDLVDAKGTSVTATGPLGAARYFHTATLLEDGRVLVVGGTADADAGTAVAAAEVFHPSTGTFTPAGTLLAPRALHSATRLGDGRVLIVGGTRSGMLIGEAEVWDPETGASAAAGTLAHPRAWTTATLLLDGRVLVAGGMPEAEVWDPATNTFAPAGTLHKPSWWGTATRLPDGRVLLVGGLAGRGFGTGDGTAVRSADVWDPATATFASAGTLVEPRGLHSATLLPDGRVLVIGGIAGAGGTAGSHRSAELWHPGTGTWALDAPMRQPRGAHTANLLPDGAVLVVGGDTGFTAGQRTTELWTPTP